MPQNIFKIYDGRNYFWQWDTNQKLIVLDETVDEVHFSNRDMTHAISKDVFTDKDGKRVCYIPDILLTLPKNLIAAAIVTDNNANKTLKQVKFAVQKRAIPSDYVVSDDVQSEDITDRLNTVEELVEDMRLNLPSTYDAKGSAEQALIDAKSHMRENYDPIGSAKDVQDRLTEEVARAKNEEAAITRGLQQANVNVKEAQNEIDALKEFVGDLPNSTSVKTIVEYIDEKTEGAISDEIIRELGVRIESVEKEIGTKLDDLSFVSYNEQELTDEQKSQARKNIGVTNSQSDWSVNDETNVAYIANRPFYVDTVLNEHKLTIAEQSSDGGSSTDSDFAKLLYENYENCAFGVYSGSWLVGNIDSVTTTDTELVIQLSFSQESGNTLKHTVKIANDYSYINWIRATELAGTKIRFIITTTEEVVRQIDQKFVPNADWNVNDENSDGYIKNRTHYDNSVVICDWDGDVSKIDDIVYVDDAPAMYRIGDCLTYTAAEVQELYETVEPKIVVSSINNYEFQYIDIMPADAEGGYGVDIYGFTGIDDAGNGATPVCLNILSDNFALEALNVVIPKKGMWLIPTSDFTVLRFYFENIKTLDPKFLPNNGQSDWNQNDETAADYIKNRPFYPMDESYIGSLNFTATGTNTVEYTYTSVDDVVLFYFQKLAGKGQVIKAKVNGCSGLIGVEFSRGYFSISGTMTGHFMFSPGRVWESTVSMDGISLTTGETYQVEFYDTTTPGYMPLDIKYLSSKVHTDERAPIQYGTGDGSTIQNGARESSGRESHAQGNNTVARGWSAHAQGAYTEANGDHTQAEGYYTIANGTNQHVQGKFNIADEDDKYAHIVGNGTNSNARSNAHTLDWYGNAWFLGDVKVGATGQDDTAAKTLATTEYVDDVVSALKPKCATVTIPSANWTGDVNPWSQVVTVNGVTSNSKVDPQPTALQIVALQDAEITLMLQNDAGVITAWAIGNKPTEDYAMDVLITEVVRV